MYNNNDDFQHYSQQTGSTPSNTGYREYYYTSDGNYGKTVDAAPAKKQKKHGGFGKKLASAAALGLVFGVIAGAAFSVPAYMSTKELKQAQAELEQLQAADESVEASSPSISTTTDSLSVSNASYSGSSSSSVAEIVENCLPSVVSITNKSVTEVRTMFGTYQKDSEGSGSGIIIGQNDSELLIVTNYHVVSGSNELTVVFSYDDDNDDPSIVSAKIKGYDSDKDLAVISVSLDDMTDEMLSQIKIATIGDSSTLQLGEEVVAIGNALGYGQSVTTGIISALNREVSITDDSGNTITNKLIQTDAAINPGNSGGALLNMNGELIGINSAKVSADSVEGMGYAIPISDVQSIIEELMLKETRDVVSESAQGYIGIGGTDVTQEISETYDMPVGIYINTIYDDSPAQYAGLSKGNIITKFDGQTVKSMNELKTLLTYYSAGETVDIIAMVQSADGYAEQTFTITLGTKDIFGETSESSSTDTSGESGGSKNSLLNPFDYFRSMP